MIAIGAIPMGMNAHENDYCWRR